jgi:hypothetical protein
MLFGASSSSTLAGNLPSVGVTEKLTRDNFLLWQAQILPDIRGAQLYGFLDGSIPAPDKELISKDQDGKEVKILNTEYA